MRPRYLLFVFRRQEHVVDVFVEFRISHECLQRAASAGVYIAGLAARLADRNQRSVCWSEDTNAVTATALLQELVAAEMRKKRKESLLIIYFY